MIKRLMYGLLVLVVTGITLNAAYEGYVRQHARLAKDALMSQLCAAPLSDRWSVCATGDVTVGYARVGCRTSGKTDTDGVIYVDWDTSTKGSVQEFRLVCD